jgi:uncharacterized membrane protein HdeD (DUF308 family)
MNSRLIMILSGVVLIAGGVLAVFTPFLASLAVTLIVGWTFVFAGALHVFQGMRNSEDRLWNIGFGFLAVLLGLSFVFNPLGGMLSLTLILGVLFFVSGGMQLYLAWKRRGGDSVGWLAVSGVISVALALVILLNLFEAAVTVPGIVLAIELISTGVGLLLLRPLNATAATSPEQGTGR